MTDAEVLALLNSDSPFNRARRVFSGESARIEQLSAQGHLSPVEIRAAEFKAVAKIAKELGIESINTGITI